MGHASAFGNGLPSDSVSTTQQQFPSLSQIRREILSTRPNMISLLDRPAAADEPILRGTSTPIGPSGLGGGGGGGDGTRTNTILQQVPNLQQVQRDVPQVGQLQQQQQLHGLLDLSGRASFPIRMNPNLLDYSTSTSTDNLVAAASTIIRQLPTNVPRMHREDLSDSQVQLHQQQGQGLTGQQEVDRRIQETLEISNVSGGQQQLPGAGLVGLPSSNQEDNLNTIGRDRRSSDN